MEKKKRRINSGAGVTLVIARFLNENFVIRIFSSQILFSTCNIGFLYRLYMESTWISCFKW